MRSIGWVSGLIRRRPLELISAALSVAFAVAFVASLGAFVAQSRAALTVRAAASVAVDWQVQVTAQGTAATVAKQLRHLPDVKAIEPVSYARVRSLSAVGPGGARQTGSAVVVSMPRSYTAHFPSQVRHLAGARTGASLLQQTAANLASQPGGSISVETTSGSRPLKVDGVADMPFADSFFQVVGLAPGSGASAPPDNVLLVPPAEFESVVGASPVVRQFHVEFVHRALPVDPATAAVVMDGKANHFQAEVAGGALVGNNLGAALTAAVEDAQYANLLFLLLGVPGIALAAAVAALAVTLRSDRRRREFALLRLRGASVSQIVRVVASEALVTAVIGIVVGVPGAYLVAKTAFAAGEQLSTGWTISAAVGGLLLTFAVQAGPVLRLAFRADEMGVAVESSRASSTGLPWPLKLGLDVILLTGAIIAFALTAHSSFQVVLAPEGIPQAQVNYAALAGPALAWPGLALLVWRLAAWASGRRTGRWTRAVQGRAPELEAAAVRRRRRLIARGATGLAVALGFAVSTAIFTATYVAQSRLDTALTVGNDVAVVEPPGSAVGPRAAGALATVPGVRSIEPLQHRFGYVGPDLQDLYGVNARTFASNAPLQDAFVPGSTIGQAMKALQTHPDGVLLSAETLHDYQLRPGDLIRIRLQTGTTHTYRPVRFHVIGQVTEWPTAPKDSFIVANASYVAARTGSDAVGTFLVSTSTPSSTAAAIRARLLDLGSAAKVLDTSSSAAQVTSASGLAGTDLIGLSRLGLIFGTVLSAACSGLALLAGIVERRRALVLLGALGATARQRGRFLAVEARALVVAGMLGGAMIGVIIAFLLVKVLTGIFDPPPSGIVVPWGYVTLLFAFAAAAAVVVVGIAGRLVGRAGPSELRDL